MRGLCFLMEDFPLNAKFLYEEPSLMVEGNRRINLASYLVREVKEALQWESAEGELRAAAEEYVRACAEVFYQICGSCTLRTS